MLIAIHPPVRSARLPAIDVSHDVPSRIVHLGPEVLLLSVPVIDLAPIDAVAGHGSARGVVAISPSRPMGSREEIEVPAVAVEKGAVVATVLRQQRTTKLKKPSAAPSAAALLHQHTPSRSTCTTSINSMTSSRDRTMAMVMVMSVRLRAGTHTPATGEKCATGSTESRTSRGKAAMSRFAFGASPRSNIPASWAPPPRDGRSSSVFPRTPGANASISILHKVPQSRVAPMLRICVT